MLEQTFKPGDRTCFGSDSVSHPYSAFFEDDGETGYFYALDRTRSNEMIVDAVHIYNVADVSDHKRESIVSIVWSPEGMKSALLINGFPHAAFDYGAKRGFCRTNFPNSSNVATGGWDGTDHQWSDDAIAWLK